jgi:iron(III) transport system substrate-binding protein
MNKLSSHHTRRNFLFLVSGAMLSSIALKGCTSRASSSSSAGKVSGTALLDEASLLKAAQQEGKLVYYTAFFTQEILNKIGAAFMKKYPGIEFEGTRKIAGPLFQQLSQEIQAGIKNCDVFSTTDVGQMLKLKSGNELLSYKPLEIDAVRAEFRNVDPENFYQAGAVLPIVIGYNTRKMQVADAPKQWADLMQPTFKDKIATGSAAVSGQVGIWAIAMDEKYGWDNYFSSLNKLNPKLGRSINDAMSDVVSGERAVGIVTLGQILTHKAKGNPVEVIYPTDGTVVAIGSSGILQNAPHPNAARLFMNFLTSKEYAEVLAEYNEQPLREDVLVKGAKALPEMKPIILTTEKIKVGIPTIKKKWRDEFGA